jgi:hypothetical protein
MEDKDVIRGEDVIYKCRALHEKMFKYPSSNSLSDCYMIMLITSVDSLTSEVRALKEDMIETYRDEQNQ